MILITVGTQRQDFSRMLEMCQNLFELKQIEEPIYIQYGESINILNKTEKKNIIAKNYFENFHNLVLKSDLIITHGGVGTIIEGLLAKKKIIAIPRLKEYNEHVNNHQIEIINKLSEEGYILFANSEAELLEAYQKLIEDNLPVKEYQSNNENFNKKLNEIIKKL